jgi:glycogen(starch) synthase
MLSPELPPLIVGGLATHVDGLSRALARHGHDVVVFTFHHDDAPDDYTFEGMRVLRAHADLPWLPERDLLARTSSANHKLVQLSAALDGWRPDVVHAHDWLVAWAGDDLRALWGVPLVATMHATERGRNGGAVPDGLPAGINAVEWWLTFHAATVITCSRFMYHEVQSAFAVPGDKLHIVPNGVDARLWSPATARSHGDHGPLLAAWGRVEYEKGFQTLIAALPLLRHAHPDLRVVVAGRGSFLGELEAIAQGLGVDHMVAFPGFLPDDELRALLHTCSCAVIPSLYEPFGIVALEALAAGAPIVAAASGGLREVLDGTGAALLHRAGDAADLADVLDRMLSDSAVAARCQAAGASLVNEVYSWDAVAAATLPCYEAVMARR